MKRFLVNVLVILAILTLVACGTSYKEGTYEGDAMGYSPDKNIKLSVTIDEEGKISKVDILDHAETQDLGGAALTKLAEYAVEKNSSEIDFIAGATVTSEGFKEALDKALEQAK